MKLIEQFYNEKIHVDGMMNFDELTPIQIEAFRDTWSFDRYKASNAIDELKKTFSHVVFLTYLFISIITSFVGWCFIVGFITIFKL